MADEQTILIYNQKGEPHEVPKSIVTPEKMAKFGYSFEPSTSSKPVDSDIHQTANPDYQASGSIQPMGHPSQSNNDQFVQQMQQKFAPTTEQFINNRPDLSKTINAVKPFIEGAGNFAAGAGLGAAEGLLGNVASVGNLAPDAINLIAGTKIPRMQAPDFSQYLPKDSMAASTGYEGGKVGGELIGGGAAFKAAKYIPKLGNEASMAQNAMRGAAAGFATGDELPYGRYEGATIGSVLAPGIKSSDKQLANIIARQSDAVKSEASKKYYDLFKRAGNDLSIPLSNENLDYDIIKRAFTKDQRINVDKYFENPTLENAHKAQSDLGYKIRKLVKKDDALDYEKIDSLKNAREAIKNGMSKTIESRIPGGSQELNKISQDYAIKYAPYLELKKLGAYKKGNATPKELLDNIKTEFRNSEAGKQNTMLKAREKVDSLLGSKVGGLASKGLGYAGAGTLMGLGASFGPDQAKKYYGNYSQK